MLRPFSTFLFLFCFLQQWFAWTHGALGQVYAASSFWYQPIPADATLNANSAGMLTNFIAQFNTYYGNVIINIYTFGAPIYIAPEGSPTVTVAQSQPPNPGLTTQWAAVPLPSWAQPSHDNDAEMVVYQPSSDQMWDFYKAVNASGVWSADWGGGMKNASTSNGIWPYPYGATATGLPILGGIITVADIQSGAINHVMGIALVETDVYTNFSWPANRSDGAGTTLPGTAIPEGMRFRLDPKIDVRTLNLTPIGTMVAKAAQTYGFVVWDKSGAISLRGQAPLSYTLLGAPDPWIPLLNGVRPRAVLDGFPWSSLQFMPMNYGQPQ